MEFPWPEALGILAGTLVLGLGAFVLKAKPGSWPHRAYFVFTLADGGSTILLNVRLVSTDPFIQVNAQHAYVILFTLFVVMLAGYGALFPRPLGGPRYRGALLLGLGIVAIALLVAELLFQPAFWSVESLADGTLRFSSGPGTNVVLALYGSSIAFVLARLTHEMLVGPFTTYRTQAGFVLGGMALGFTPPVTSALGKAFAAGPASRFLSSDLTLDAVYWSFAIALVTVASCLVLLFSRRHLHRGSHHRFVLGSFVAVLVLTTLGFVFSDPVSLRIIQNISFLAYPICLAYAIARFEVLEIDAKVRRAATFSLAATALGVVFVTTEQVGQNLLQSVLGPFAPSLVAGVIAALITAAAASPLAKAARRLGRRIAPDLPRDELDERRRDIYRHALEGTLQDGLIDPQESSTLKLLRESLGLTMGDHAVLLAAVTAGQ